MADADNDDFANQGGDALEIGDEDEFSEDDDQPLFDVDDAEEDKEVDEPPQSTN